VSQAGRPKGRPWGRAALWLLAGEGIVLLLSLFRGLHRCVRDLRTDLRGEPY